ncbi:MAG: acyltransferase [Desulfobacteraceae bacterium]|nr:acyltransferase [Desulfobacteraceae bacterium]
MNTQALSLFRFIAAVIIITFHFGKKANLISGLPNLFTAGPQMVTFFFTLSGFVLTLAYYNRSFTKKQFWTKRLKRIYPLYFLALAIVVLIDYYKGSFQPVPIFLHLAFLQSWIPSFPLSLNGPAWFVSDLMFFYLIFPFILKKVKIIAQNRYKFLLLSILVWLLTQIILVMLLNSGFYADFPSLSKDLIYYFPPSHFCSFLLGISGAFYVIKGREKSYPKSGISTFMILVSCMLIFFLIENQNFIVQTIGLNLPFGSSIYAPFFLIFIITFSNSNSPISLYLSSKLFRFLGDISFSIYILQSPIYSIVEIMLSNFHLNYDSIFLIFLIILAISGVLAHYLIENNKFSYCGFIDKFIKK